MSQHKEDYEEHFDEEGLENPTSPIEEIENQTLADEQEVEELDKESMLTAELNEAKDKYARLMAEFENYKKRTSKERIETIQSASKDVLVKILPVLDDLDRAMLSVETATDIEPIKEGISLVNSKFRKTLEQQGLKEMEVLGESFDSEFQEAITAIPSPSEELKNKVLDVIEKGYYLNEKVVRFAKVVIGK